MKRPVAYPRVLFVSLVLLHVTEMASAASGDPPILLPRMTMMTHGASEKCQVLFSSDGERLFVIPNDITDKVAKVPKGLEGRTPSLASAQIQAVRDSVADGSTLRANQPKADPQIAEGAVVRGGERTAPVMLYDVTSGAQVARWGNGRSYENCAISPDGETFIGFSGWTGSLELWDVTTGTLRKTIEVSPGDLKKVPSNTPIEVTPDGAYIVASVYSRTDRKRVVRRYDLISGRPIDEFDYTHGDGRAPGLAISSNGLYLATNNLIWDMSSGKLICELQNRDGNAQLYLRDDVTFTPDGKHLLGLKQGQEIAVANVVGGTVTTRVFPGRYNVFALSPDGSLVAAYKTSGEYYIRLCDPETGRLIARLAPVPASTYSLSFAPDGKALAAGCYDGATRIWDTSQFVRDEDPARAIQQETVK